MRRKEKFALAIILLTLASRLIGIDVDWRITATLGGIAIFFLIWGVIDRRSDTKLRFCDDRGRYITNRPKVNMTKQKDYMSHLINGFFRMSNPSKDERSIENIFLVAKTWRGKEISNHYSIHMGLLGAFSFSMNPGYASPKPIEISQQILVSKSKPNYLKSRIWLVVEASDKVIKIKLPKHEHIV